jgi:UPF0755 protein
MGVLKFLFGLVLVLALLAAAAVAGGYFWLKGEIAKPGPSTAEQTVTVASGETLNALSTRLETEGLVSDARLVKLAARLELIPTNIRQGEYVIPAGASVTDIVETLISDNVILYRITIPEGLTTAQILRRIEADPVLTGDLPDPLPGEGTLLPDTYSFSRGMTRAELIALMQTAQADLIAELWLQRTEDAQVATPEEAVILASVVQEEAANLEEIDLIAGVFTTRLKRGMKLESDPTVIYGVSGGEPLVNRKGERRTLYRSELDRETPWNTYIIPGLPETPICNPGKEAIAAVLAPPETEYLFFVADGQGGHLFAETYAEHRRNVEAYRDYERAEIARERGE